MRSQAASTPFDVVCTSTVPLRCASGRVSDAEMPGYPCKKSRFGGGRKKLLGEADMHTYTFGGDMTQKKVRNSS